MRRQFFLNTKSYLSFYYPQVDENLSRLYILVVISKIELFSSKLKEKSLVSYLISRRELHQLVSLEKCLIVAGNYFPALNFVVIVNKGVETFS